jgi:transcriptional regulator with XRE-family HTH domain
MAAVMPFVKNLSGKQRAALEAERAKTRALGQALRAARADAGLSQKYIAISVDITQAYLSQIEHGHCAPSEALLDRIAAELKTTARSLRQRAGRIERAGATEAA